MGRYIYVIFMCHLAIEKAFKAIVVQVLGEEAPKTHDLMYLCRLGRLEIGGNRKLLLQELNDVSILTRYTERLSTMAKIYTQARAKHIMNTTEGVLLWVKSSKKK